MNRSEITDGVAALLEEFAFVDPSDVTETKRFRDDLDVDSLSMVEVIVGAEEKYGIKITDEQAAGFTTVGDLVGQIDKALNAVQA